MKNNLVIEKKKDIWGGAVNYQVKDLQTGEVLFESYCEKDAEDYLKGGKK